MVNIDLTVEEDAEGKKMAVLAIRDTGIGIPETDLPRVFERFHRGSNMIGTFPGSGIGLAGARQNVEQHEGTIGVESRQGEGTLFHSRLPCD